MNDKTLYKIWAPTYARWVDWVRPLPFIGATRLPKRNFELPEIYYQDQLLNHMALFLDLPYEESVLEALSLAKKGYRPIALFNGTTPQEGSFGMVDQTSISQALVFGASILETLSLKEDALPVFMLDSNRILRHKPSINTYDNSWDLYDQDIPSIATFQKYGIDKILIRSLSLNRDLKRIFYKFQKKGIKIFYTNGYDGIQEIKLKKPPKKDKFH